MFRTQVAPGYVNTHEMCVANIKMAKPILPTPPPVPPQLQWSNNTQNKKRITTIVFVFNLFYFLIGNGNELRFQYFFPHYILI